MTLTDHPIVALPLGAALAGYLDEALVEGEVVADGILPTLQQKIIVNVNREETSTNPKDLAMGTLAAGVTNQR